MVFQKNAELLIFMQFLDIFPKLPPSHSQYQLRNPGPGTSLDTMGSSLKYLEKQTMEDTMENQKVLLVVFTNKC